MIKPPSLITVADNSGAIKIGCIQVPKRHKRIGIIPGSKFTASVKENIFKKHIKKKSRIINKGQIVQALLITSAKGVRRLGNWKTKSSYNVAVILNQYDLPYGTRIVGPVFREIRQKLKYRKVISLAQLII